MLQEILASGGAVLIEGAKRCRNSNHQGETLLEFGQMPQLNGEMSQVQGQTSYHQGGTLIESGQMPQLNGQMSQASGEMSQAQGKTSYHQGGTLIESGQMPQLPQSVVKVRTSRKASLEEKEQAIIELCRGQWVSMTDLIRILDRDRRTLQRTLRPMVHHGLLEVRYPRHQNHPQQSYRARQQEP